MVSVHLNSLPVITYDKWFSLFTLFLLAGILLVIYPVTASTTSLHIVELAMDGKTTLSSKDVDVAWMETNLPVYGDGVTHYYHQGPVFIDNPDPAKEESLRWNSLEDTNVKEKDMGAVKGTAVKDLVDLVGGMEPGDTVTLRARDGFTKTFAYRNIYQPTDRQGPMVITWYREGEGYVPNFTTGMRLVFFADTSSNPWGIHAFGNWDWHESADPQYFYYYVQGGERYPTTTGLSVQQVSEIIIHKNSASPTTGQPTPTTIPLPPITIVVALLLLTVTGVGMKVFRRGEES
ncbi:MAG: argininosuccinate synthase [Methanolinea sp.]|jgi:hypothetical protein|nr:argininosuccinate synthase [Methanolinea sp.]